MTYRVVVIGASGFGRECLDVLEAMIAAGADLQILGAIDDNPSEANLGRLAARSMPYLGTRAEWLASTPANVRYVLGIGHPTIRRALAEELDASGLEPFTAIHPSATFGANTTLAVGVVVCAGAAISNNVYLGRHVHVNPNATIGHDAILYDFVSVNPAAIISGEVAVGAETLIGAGATVLQGLVVSGNATVGAGAVVTRNVPSRTVVKGVPGRWTDPRSDGQEDGG